MKSVIRLFKSFDRKEIEREVGEELDFHLELITQNYLQQGMSLEEAKESAQKRFGDFERVKNQCVEISKRSHPFIRALKIFLITVFLTGILLRIFSPEFHVTQVGNMLIVIAALSRLLLYLRGLNPLRVQSKNENSSPLMLGENSRMAIETYDDRELTPVERVIADKQP
jgi:hypothetical protein